MVSTGNTFVVHPIFNVSEFYKIVFDKINKGKCIVLKRRYIAICNVSTPPLPLLLILTTLFFLSLSSSFYSSSSSLFSFFFFSFSTPLFSLLHIFFLKSLHRLREDATAAPFSCP
uniref:Uncharacterized protein n=1 Tax=Cacopsylla melanoneura TaxID=428564 RepID=A0A8D8ZAB4_9HEMI